MFQTAKQKFFYIFFLFFSISFSQDISTIKKAEPFTVSGSFSIGTNFFQTSRDLPRLTPFSYIISGNPVFSIYNVKIPFTLTYSDQQVTYVKPFQRYGMSPNYKWIKVHLGHRIMEFTPYSLSGQTFLGAGLELTPGNFKFLAFYGKFENIYAIYNPFDINVEIPETYKRKGFGFKVGYGSEKAGFNISLIKIEDKDPENLQAIDTLFLKPKENLVISPDFHFLIRKHLKISSTLAASVITNNKSAGTGYIHSDIINKYSKYITINHSTKLALAGDIATELIFDKFNIGVKYQRIEPLYESLGLYGILNDFENYTVNAGANFFKKQIQIKITQGYQRNNLKNLRQVTDLQKIGSYNINLGLKNGLNINAQYSNFQNDQSAGYIEVNDTLRLALVGKNGSLASSYRWNTSKKNKQHIVSFFAGMQSYKDINNSNSITFDNQNTSANLSYRIKFKPQNLSVKTGINYSNFESTYGITNRIGALLGFSKKLFDKKMRLSFRTAYQKSQVDNQDDGFVLRGRLGINYKLNKNNSITVQTNVINRNSIIKEPFTDYRGRISYIYRF